MHSFWIFLTDCELSGSAVSAFGWLAGPSLVCKCGQMVQTQRAEGVCVPREPGDSRTAFGVHILCAVPFSV